MDDILDLDGTVEDTVMIKNVLTVLARHYPNHPWAVRIDGGINAATLTQPPQGGFLLA